MILDQTSAFAKPRIQLPPSVSRGFLIHHGLCPFERDAGGSVVVAVTDDTHREALHELSLLLGPDMVEERVSTSELTLIIERVTSANASRSAQSAPSSDAMLVPDVRDLAKQPPVVRFVNFLVQEAHDSRASDIHLESTRGGLTSRLRVDGRLIDGPPVPPGLEHAVVSRIKLLAELDIAERRHPQDGRVRAQLTNRELDLRVSTVPTIFGESVVLRLLYQRVNTSALSELGLGADDRAALADLVRRRSGLVLATGPTGSGKTTTLHAALQLRAKAEEKIITIEDPVEYELADIVQMPVDQHSGVGFASALRSVLRQDPDVILVGELRDGETASLAIQASLTGHLVLSTLHTTDTSGAIPRLFDLGAAPFLVAATLAGVLAQRLVRRICPHCAAAVRPDEALVDGFAEALCREDRQDVVALLSSPSRFARGRGCAKCRGTGYLGRIALFELLLMTDDVRDAVIAGAGRQQVRALALEAGMRPLRVDGWRKVQGGLTTLEEVARVAA